MSRAPDVPSEPDDKVEKFIRYEKDAKTRIATFQGEYLGSMLSGLFEPVGGKAQRDAEGEFTLDSAFRGAIPRGLGGAVKDNDDKFSPECRLSKKGRNKNTKPKSKH